MPIAAEGDAPLVLLFVVLLLTSVMTTLKRVEEHYHQVLKDATSLSSASLHEYLASLPASLVLSGILHVTTAVYGAAARQDWVFVFGIVNTLAAVLAAAVMHSEIAYEVRSY